MSSKIQMVETTKTHAEFSKPVLLVDGVRREISMGLFRVGRDSGNNLVIDDPNLSRSHFLLDIQPYQAQLIDLGSSNGTYVNKKLVRSAWLQDGDKIQVGDHVLLFQAPGYVALDDSVEEKGPLKIPEFLRQSVLPLLALLVGTVSLFVQLDNREKLIEYLNSSRIQPVLESKPVIREPEQKPHGVEEKPEEIWQKALLEFKMGSEEEACNKIKELIPKLGSKNILRAKASSFFERKCVF